MKKENPYLLPETCKPLHYDLEIEPEIEKNVCKGKVSIALEVLSSTKEIELNSKEIKITSAKVNAQEAATITYNHEKDTVKLVFTAEIPRGKADVHIVFESVLREDLRGLYKSVYEVNSQKKTLLTTQFEATDARRCFPCFDEPALKATFTISYIIQKDLVAISNMPIQREIQQGGKKKVTFEKSPIMSTYLLAFLIGEFEGIQKETKSGITVGVWTTPGKKHQGRFALDVAVKALEYYESYFNIPYPLPKLDLIAVPDFESGAMENWGAIIYREVALLYDEKVSSVAAKDRIGVVVAHELAHQWFGNLVTMKWWNDLWLNEGFASWMECKALDHLFPEWEMWVKFYTEDQGSAFSLDGLESSHPIEVEVVNPAQIDEIFDAVSYSKGASVIRMLEQYLGEEAFRKGLQRYLNKFKYANATTKDLWESLSLASGKPVREIMDTWTKQMGYPLVTAEVTKEKIRLAQERFFLSGRKKDAARWRVPLALEQGEKAEYLLLEKETQEIPKAKSITLINKDQVGLYRVKYDSLLFKEQLEALTRNQLSVLDKIGLVGNAFALAEAKYTDLNQFLDLLQHVKEEANYTLWTEVLSSISFLQMAFAQKQMTEDLDALTRWVCSSILKKVGWEEKPKEKNTEIFLRLLILSSVGFSEESAVQEEAKKRFQHYLATKEINSNLKGVVYALAAWSGDIKTWEALKKLHQEATLQEEQMRVLGAMCMFQQQELLKKTLDYCLSPAVRAQDSPSGIARIARNPFGIDLAWDFFKEHWKELHKRYGAGGHIMGRLIPAVGAGFSTQEKKEEVREFFKLHPVPHAKRAIEQTVESIELNSQFIQRHEKSLISWLQVWKQQRKEQKT